MEHEKIVKTACFGLVLCLGINSLMGCSGKTVDYDVEGVTESGQEGRNGGKRGLEQFADAPAWKQEFTVTLSKKTGSTAKIQIGADILVPEAEQMSVIEVHEPEFDNTYKEKLVGRIFGSEEVYYNDIPHLPIDALKERYDFYERGGYAGAGCSMEEQEEWLAACDEAMEQAVEEARNTYTPVNSFTSNEYLGKRDGISYELAFVERTNERDAYRPVRRRTKEISLIPKNIRQLCPQELREEEILSYVAGTSEALENQCKLSEEEAKGVAQEFIDKLKLEYSVCADSQSLIWSNSSYVVMPGTKEYIGNGIADGYVFYYDLGIEDVSVVAPGSEENYMSLYNKKKDTEETRYSMEARMEIYVTDDGVIQMNAHNPLEITGISRDVELLPLDSIFDIMEAQLTERAARFRFNISKSGEEIPMNEMELIYFRIRDEKNPGYYSYVPAWRLAAVSRFEQEPPVQINAAVLVNTIDGSEIDLYNEM